MSTAEQRTLDAGALVTAFSTVRQTTEELCKTLATEDYVIQAMADVSPTKWHIAHVTWFFETFLLKPHLVGYESLNPQYEYLFNSYYNTVGPQYFRHDRGLLSRPTVAEVYEYRSHVDRGMMALLEQVTPEKLMEIAPVVELGLNHEQQHQELLITDIKYNLSINPLRPAFHDVIIPRGTSTPALRWHEHSGGVREFGFDGPGFTFDNETPRHTALLQPHRLASRLVTCGEFLEFIDDGGYQRHDLWLSQGWGVVQERGWQSPLYWEHIDGARQLYTMSGMQSLDQHSPVCHVSYFEADAFARWAGKRLPTEEEWEAAADGIPLQGNLQESGILHPVALGEAAASENTPQQLIGDVWEWTQSAYLAYPGYKPLTGGLGEYNGKFMMSQMVLRGGSCATPQSHIRTTYRNFFYPADRWQFKGFRLAEDV